MLSKLFNSTKFMFGFRDMKKAFFQFLDLEIGAVYRGAPQFKQRKYVNIEISQKFKELQAKRKQERLIFIQKRKKLLEEKIRNEAQLLSHYEKQQLDKLNQELKSLRSVIDEQNKELIQIDKQLEETEAEHILVEGIQKILVLNIITYYKHMNSIPSGVVLTPQSIKCLITSLSHDMQNFIKNRNFMNSCLVCLLNKQNNLQKAPKSQQIRKIQTFFKKLLLTRSASSFDKSENVETFMNVQISLDKELAEIKLQTQNMLIDICLNAARLLEKHQDYIQKVIKGKTPFRSMDHCIFCLTSTKLNLKLNEEEQAFKKTALQILSDYQKFHLYNRQAFERAEKIQYSYQEPPIWIKYHPVLAAAYEKVMEIWANPVSLEDSGILPNTKPDDEGRAFMQQKIRKEVEKYDEEFVRLWNQNKTLLITRKKEIQIQFYKLSTKILEEYKALEDKNKPEEQFIKLLKKPRPKEEKFMRITMDQLTKMIFLNNNDKKKYNLDFFARYFGIESPEQKKYLYEMLNFVSYLRVEALDEKRLAQKKQAKVEVLKFIS